jgi:PAS domain S-box-containing protein
VLAFIRVAASPKRPGSPGTDPDSTLDREPIGASSILGKQGAEPDRSADPDELDRHRTTLLNWRGDSARSAIPLLRGGGALMFAFQSAYLIVPDELHTGPLVPLILLHLTAIYFGALLFALSFADWCHGHWRIAAWFTCAAEILTMLALAILTNDPEALFVAIVGVVIGAGALLPWNARWQGALGAVAIASFAGVSLWAREPEVNILWLGVIIAVVLAQAACMMAARYRSELEAQVMAAGISHRQLRLEMVKHAESERRAQVSAATMRSVFENLNDIAIVGTLKDRTFAMVNQAFENAFGLRREAVLGRPIGEFGIWRDAGQRESFVSELKAGREVRNFEAEFRLGDGTIITGLVSGVALELDGNLCGVAMIRDITAISAARTELQRSQSRLRTILDASTDAISIYSVRRSKFTFANYGLYDALGLTPKQVLGHSSSDLNLWADPETMREYDRRIGTDGTVRNMEVSFRRADGTLIPALVSSVKTDLGGEPCIISFTREISTLKRKERELEAARAELARQLDALRGSEARRAESEAKLRTIFNANRDFIAINAFPSGEYIEINDEVVRRSGLPREQILGHRTSELGFWVDNAKFAAFAAQLHDRGEVRSMEVDLRIGGEIAALDRARHLRVPRGAGPAARERSNAAQGVRREFRLDLDQRSRQRQISRRQWRIFA